MTQELQPVITISVIYIYIYIYSVNCPLFRTSFIPYVFNSQ